MLGKLAVGALSGAVIGPLILVPIGLPLDSAVHGALWSGGLGLAIVAVMAVGQAWGKGTVEPADPLE